MRSSFSILVLNLGPPTLRYRLEKNLKTEGPTRRVRVGYTPLGAGSGEGLKGGLRVKGEPELVVAEVYVG